MKTRNKFSLKMLSVFLSIAIIMGVMPFTAFADNSPLVQTQTDGKVVDAPTVNSWHSVFPNNTTENAGGVWADKSVFADVDSYKNATDENDDDLSIAMQDEANNFLVSLSAMSSTKSIIGYSTIPTDTVLVLDMSSSMRNNGNYIDDLAIAANSAIKRLINLNYNNRVSVILYSGAGKTNVFMPLDRYTAGTDGNFLQYLRVNNREGISTVDGVKRNGSAFSKQDSYNSGTFTQDGIYQGMKQLLNSDTVVTDGVQAGVSRMPIMVLMTDGEPSHSDSEFSGNNGADTGLTKNNYNSSSYDGCDFVDFLNQLNAAYAKLSVEEKYKENDMLFYTVGFRLGALATVPILDPSNKKYTDTDDYWSNFLEGNIVKESTTCNVNDRSVNPNDYSEFVAALKGENGDRYRYYSNRYLAPANGEELTTAFDAIVDEIVLQSKYYPTHVESGSSVNYGGYLSITDTLGEYMEVKDIKGIQLGEHLFTGSHFVSMLNSNVMGSPETPTPKGDELIRAIRERLGIDKITAQNLVDKAYQAGQLSYTNDSNFSNWIGWYGNYIEAENRWQFKGFWDGVEGSETTTPRPLDATYQIKSYLFYGEATEGTKESDMLYAACHIQKNLDNDVVKVYCRAPASLIPMREYNITLEAEDLTDPSNFTVSGSNYPIRLLYEVGLKDGINSLNIETKAPNALNSSSGEYVFYSNAWPDGAAASSMPEADTSHVLFYASKENERYYFHNDSLIYSDTSGTLYTGDKPTAANGTYYTLKNVYTGSGSNVSYLPVYEEIIDGALADINVAQNGDGYWYIKKGTPRLDKARSSVEKGAGDNLTGTYSMVERPEVYNTTEYRLQSMLGNNGKLTVVPAQGIKLRKYVRSGDINDPINADTEYEFEIKAAGTTPSLDGTYSYFVADGVYDTDPTGTEQNVTAVSGVIKVKLKKLQTAYIVGLPVGDYEVNEVIPSDSKYMVGGFRINQVEQPIGTPVAVTQNKLTAAAFLNVDRTLGQFRLSKFVDSSYEPHETNQFEFTFNVKVELPTTANASYYHTYSSVYSNGEVAPTIDLTGDGVDNITVTLSANEYFSIPELPTGAIVTATETKVGKTGETPKDFATENWGFITTVYNSPTDTGTVTREGSVVITDSENNGLRFLNAYKPEDAIASNITVTAHKNYNNWATTDSFEFNLVRSGVATPISTANIVYADSVKQKALSMATQTYNKVGTYVYSVSETNGGKPYIEYDSIEKTFGVVVSDDGFGKLYISDVHDHQADALIKSSGDSVNGWTVDAYFTNIYTTTGSVHVDLGVQKTVENPSNASNVLSSGYRFELYKVNSFTGIDLDDLILSTGSLIQKIETSATGHADFDDLIFNPAAGNAKYIVVEHKDSKAGVTYDDTVYAYDVIVGSVLGNVTVKVDAYKGSIDRTTNIITIDTTATPTTKDAVYDSTQPIPVIEFDGAFNNIYNPTPVNLQIPASKTLNGRNMISGEFAIELYKTGSDFATVGISPKVINVDAANDGDKVSFNFEFKDAEAFAQVGTYHFVMKEQIPAILVDRVQYDDSEYHITVVIGNNVENGALYVVSTSVTLEGQADTTDFVNTYTPQPVSQYIYVDKTLKYINTNVNIPFSNQTFKVGLYAATDTAFANPLRTADIGDANSAKVGRAIFNLTYDHDDIGVHNYVIREIIPTGAVETPAGSGNYIFNGCRYDLRSTPVTVTVNYNATSGTLSAVLTNTSTNAIINPGDVAAIIENEYSSAFATVNFSGTKYLNDTKFTEKQKFYFELYKTGSDFAISGIAPETPVLEVEVDDMGDTISDGFKFQEEFKQPGAYHYVLKEQIPSNADMLMNYDPNIYQITVLVTDNGQGKLSAVPTVFSTSLQGEVAVNRLDFYNTRLRPDDLKVELAINKKVEGVTHTAEGFNFKIREYDTAAYANVISETPIVSDVNGKAKIVIPFTEADIDKTFYFEAVETAGTEQYMSYDKTIYRYSVLISLNSEKELVAEVENISEKKAVITDSNEDNPITVISHFVNKFTPPENVVIEINKTVKNLGKESIIPENFRFIITETDKGYKPLDLAPDTALAQTVTSNAKGYAVFDKIEMAYDSVRYFTVAEVADNRDYVTYDNTVYKICVEYRDGVIAITSNPKGKLAEKTLSLSFENLYDYTIPTPNSEPEIPTSPQTGDNSNLNLWLALLFVSGGGIIGTSIYGRKKKEK